MKSQSAARERSIGFALQSGVFRLSFAVFPCLPLPVLTCSVSAPHSPTRSTPLAVSSSFTLLVPGRLKRSFSASVSGL